MSSHSLGSRQRPQAAQLVARELEQELAVGQPTGRVELVQAAAAVPDDDRAGAVVVRRNDALEIAVLEGMVLGGHRQALLGRVQRGSLGHRPGDQHAVDLQPQVVVATARGMLLHHEHAGALGARDERLRGGADPALGSIGCEAILGHRV
jgi:hypothetical protein